MAVITTIAIASVVALSSAGLFKFGQNIAGGGSGTGFHELGFTSLNSSNLLTLGVHGVVSPFVSVWQFLLEYLITPLILIGFAILFIVAQYWLFKLYFKLGKNIYIGVLKVIETLSFSENKWSQKLQKFFDFN